MPLTSASGRTHRPHNQGTPADGHDFVSLERLEGHQRKHDPALHVPRLCHILAREPEAFWWQRQRYVDALVFHRFLDADHVSGPGHPCSVLTA
jgi:hypothetical protein